MKNSQRNYMFVFVISLCQAEELGMTGDREFKSPWLHFSSGVWRLRKGKYGVQPEAPEGFSLEEIAQKDISYLRFIKIKMCEQMSDSEFYALADVVQRYEA